MNGRMEEQKNECLPYTYRSEPVATQKNSTVQHLQAKATTAKKRQNKPTRENIKKLGRSTDLESSTDDTSDSIHPSNTIPHQDSFRPADCTSYTTP